MKTAKAILPLIVASACVAPHAVVEFLNGLCPQPQLGLLSLATGLLALAGWIGGLVAQHKQKSLSIFHICFLALLGVLGTYSGSVGYQFRPTLFQHFRLALGQAVTIAMEDPQISTERRIPMPEELSNIAKFGTVQKKDAHGEASNPTGLSNTAANGPKP